MQSTHLKGYLLFLDDFGHFMVEGHLHLLAPLFYPAKEHHASFNETTEHPLNEATTFQNGVVVPLDFEHAPVLLDGPRCQPLLIPPSLALTIK
jgi:hypothetical protein